MATIILTGGGTGGHVIPALALLSKLKEKFDRIVFIGGDGMEGELVKAKGIPFFQVETIKFDRAHAYNNIKIPFRLQKGISECKKIFDTVRPDVVFSKGGYVALPACFAAKKAGIPVVCHESDYSVGLANRITSRFCAKMLTSFEDTPGGVFVGNPVREEVLTASKMRAMKKYPFRNDKKTVLIFGGSQGSSAINEVVYNALPELTEKYNVIHVSGKSGDRSVPDTTSYRQLVFAPDIFDLFALADIIVCRGGANTLFEVAAVGKPTLCIPLPKGTSRGDQELNAEYFREKGFVNVLEQNDLFVESLLYNINELQDTKPPVLDVSKINERIVNEIVSVIK